MLSRCLTVFKLWKKKTKILHRQQGPNICKKAHRHYSLPAGPYRIPFVAIPVAMAAQCCTTRIAKRWGCASYQENLEQKHTSTVMSHTMPESRIFGLHFCSGHHGSSFSYFNTAKWQPIGETTWGEMTQNNGHYALQGHSCSPLPGPIKSSYVSSC